MIRLDFFAAFFNQIMQTIEFSSQCIDLTGVFLCRLRLIDDLLLQLRGDIYQRDDFFLEQLCFLFHGFFLLIEDIALFLLRVDNRVAFVEEIIEGVR